MKNLVQGPPAIRLFCALLVVCGSLQLAVAAVGGTFDDDVTIRLTLTGRVFHPEGHAAAGGVVITSAGGMADIGVDGAFLLDIDVPPEARALVLTAVANGADGASRVTRHVTGLQFGGSQDIGELVLEASGGCDPAWVSTFGGASGFNSRIFALAVFNDGSGSALYAGGVFTKAGAVTANRVAKWNGSTWSSLGVGSANGVSSTVYALTVFDDGSGDALYVGGSFEAAGGMPANRVAKWDGSTWTTLGTGVDNVVRALTTFDDGGGEALYAAGVFTAAGGVAANRIAKWKDDTWSALGSGLNNSVRALAAFDNGVTGPALYVGGGFTTAGGASSNYIARWNGTGWDALGEGMSSWVYALTVFDDGTGEALYAGGDFTTAEGVPTNRVTKWDGILWSPLGDGLNDNVQALAVFDDGTGPSMYVGGNFTTAGGLAANRIAKWDGLSWSTLESGMSDTVHALAMFEDLTEASMFAGGTFITSPAGDNFLARWTGCPPVPDPTMISSREVSFRVAAPDLEVVDVSMPPSAEEGDTVQITRLIQNVGLTGLAGNWSDLLWLVPDLDSFPEAAIPLTSPGGSSVFPVSESLAQGEQATLDDSVLLPNLPGTYYVVTQADQAMQLDEGGEVDNNFAISDQQLQVTAIPLPDLVPGPVLAQAPGAGDTVTSGDGFPNIAYGVFNNGTGPTSSSWIDRLYLCNGPSLSGATLLSTAGNLFGLGPGGSYPGQFNITLPMNIQGVDYYLGLVVDSPGNGNVVEEDETNNVLFQGPFTIALQAQPDLEVMIGTSPQVKFVEGQILSEDLFQWTVSNTGDVPTPTGTWKEALYFSKTSDDDIGPDDTLLAVYQRGGASLVNGAQETHPLPGESFQVVVPPGVVPDGQPDVEGWFKVVVDWQNQVTELDPLPAGEGNNVAVSPGSGTLLPAPLPNLVAVSVEPSTGAFAGFPLPVTFSVDPTGGAVSGAYPLNWSDRLSLVPESGGAEINLNDYPQSNQPDSQGVWQGVPYDKGVTPLIAAGVPEGMYRLRLQVDFANMVEEIDEGDNEVFSEPFEVIFEPVDLAITIPAGGAPASGAIQQTVSFSWTVTNVSAGMMPQTTWTDRIHLSLDGVTPIGGPIVSKVRSGGLVPGQSYTATANGVLPTLTRGAYFLLYTNDVFDQVPDIDLSNDTATAPFTLDTAAADLIVTNVNTDREALEGQPFTVSWTVQNQGSLASAALPWTDRVWFSDDPVLDGSDLLLGTWLHSGSLAIGGSYNASRVVNIPYGVTGVQYLLVETDATDKIYEANNANNLFPRQMLMVGATATADLTVQSVGAQQSGTSGQPLQVSWTIKNVGPGPTDQPDWIDRVYLSTDTTLDGNDTFLGFYEHDAFLAPQQSIPLTLDFNIPPDFGGDVFVIVHTNAQGVVTEDFPASNIGVGAYTDPDGVTVPIDVDPPLPGDLVVTSVEALGTWEVNEPVQVRYQLDNIGDNAVQGQWTDAVFLSLDDKVDGTDVLVAQYTYTTTMPLAPMGSVQVDPQPFELPGVLPDDYHVLVIADIMDQIPEEGDPGPNLGASDDPTLVDLPELTIGTPLELDLSSGQSAWFRMTVPANTTVQWTATHDTSSAWVSLYGSQGALPTPGSADSAGLIPASDVQTALVEGGTGSPDWYGLVRATTGAPAGSMLQISAEIVPLVLASVSPTDVGTGDVTLRLSGSKLGSVTSPADVEVFNGGATLSADSLLFDPVSGDLQATFALDGAAFGTYSLRVQTPSGAEQDTLAGALQLEAPQPGLASLRFVPPAGIKHGNTGYATAHIANAGNVDLPASGLVMVLDKLLGSGSDPDGLQWLFPGTAGSSPGINDTVESVVLMAPALAPGQETESLVQISVPADFVPEDVTFGLTGRPLIGSTFFAPGSPSVLGDLSEALRQGVLESPDSPADLLALASDATAWTAVADATFTPLASSTVQFMPQAVGLGSYLEALSLAVAAAVPSQTGPSADTVAEVRGDLGCTLFGGTSFDCSDLLPPEECNPGQTASPLLVSSSLESPIKAVCFDTPFSIDPNEKGGTPGFGGQQQVSSNERIPYRIDFENVASAQASAASVVIEDPIQAGFDPSTFELRRIRFGDVVVEVPPGNQSYSANLDLTEELGLFVQVSAFLAGSDDGGERRFSAFGAGGSSGVGGSGTKVVWNLLAIDPTTGLPPVGGMAGVLPPSNPETNDGKGSVEFDIVAATNSETGDLIKNRARIKFDVEAPMVTNDVENTVDANPPSSALTGGLIPGINSSTPDVKPILDEAFVALNWAGEDDPGGSGILGYTVEVSVDSGPFTPILVDTTETSLEYPVEPGGVYAFQVRARDNTGQLEDAPDKPDLVVFAGVDCNGNGVPDEIDVASGTSADCNFNNVPDECEKDSDGDGIIDGCRTLTAFPRNISVSSGGVQKLSLQAGLVNADRIYQILGSITGTSPGTPFGTVNLPLNVDQYTLLTFGNPGGGFLTSNPGVLDAQGQATATLVLPPHLGHALIGLQVHHAYVLMNPIPDFVSNPARLNLTH